MGLPSRLRLRDRHRIREVLARGRRLHGPVGSLSLLAGETDSSRLCCAFSRRTGGAVQRNRGRRRVQEAFRGLLPRVSRPWDCVFRARPPAVETELGELTAALAQLLAAAGALE